MSPGDGAQHSAGRVLVAEDDARVRAACVRVLRSAGFTIAEAADGRAAAALLDDGDFDVVVSDIAMPGIDGMELLRRVRARDLDMPVLLMTGTPSIDTAAQAVEMGALRYLLKPFEPHELARAVEKAVRLHRLARLKRQALELIGADDQLLGDRAGLDVKLDRALETLWMAYQPIVCWSTRSVFAYEALMRCDEPTLPHPGAVLRAAERLGRVDDVGRRVRETVARTLGETDDTVMFVNLHTRDLLDEQLFAETAPLAKYSGRVVLEITERVALDGVPDPSARVHELRDLGYRIAVDDLGAGYAGLTSFAQLEPDIVKLDMSLVRDIDRHATRRALVASLYGVCKELDVQVVTEGIETPAERDAIVEAGGDLLQGYLFGRPARELKVPIL